MSKGVEFNKIMAIVTTLLGETIPTSHGVVIKTKTRQKGGTNIVLKGLATIPKSKQNVTPSTPKGGMNI